MTRVLVTGGSGFLGSALVFRLVKAGYSVRVLDDNSRGSARRLQSIASEVDFMEGDIRDADAVRKVVKGQDWVFHLAFVNGTEFFYKYPGHVLDVGVRGHINIMDACLSEGIEKFIYASSSEVYQTPPSIPTDESAPCSIPDVRNPRYSYGGGKLIGELMTLHNGSNTGAIGHRVIFRPHNFYGPDMGHEHVIPQLIKKIRDSLQSDGRNTARIQLQGNGEQTRAFCYVQDGADGALLVAENGQNNAIYHIGTQQEITIRQLVEAIADQMGLEVEVELGPMPEGGTLRRCPDISKLRGIGYEPKWSLEDGLRETVPWYVERYSAASKGGLRRE